jgi:hypothetical protein
MRTITDEVGSGPIEVFALAATDTEEGLAHASTLNLEHRAPAPKREFDDENGLDGKRELCEPNPKGGTVPLGNLSHALDIGPHLSAAFAVANDNNITARKTDNKPYPLKEMFERGELGINEPENRRHWFDAQRFKQVHADARGEPTNNSGQDDWREIMLQFFEGFFADLVTSFNPDDGLQLGDDMEFEDSALPSHCEVVDFAGWNPYRDPAPHVYQLYAQQIVALMADVLGNDYEVLCAAIERGWTSQQIGETEGYKDRASASACGKGMQRAALRNLSRFYVCLDRLEDRGERPPDVWPLVGAYTWPSVKFTNQAAVPVRTPSGLKLAA